jgi:hypothetical protein
VVLIDIDGLIGTGFAAWDAYERAAGSNEEYGRPSLLIFRSYILLYDASYMQILYLSTFDA